MKRMALYLFFLLVVSGCELGTDAVDDSDYWWLDDPRFAEVLDQIDVKASLPLEEFGMVFLKPQSYSGEEARKRFIDRYGAVGYHLMVWHPEEFDTMIQEHNGNLDFLKQKEGEPEPNVVDICEACPDGHEEGCDDGGGGGSPPPPPPDLPFQFEGTTTIIPSGVGPLVTVWTVVLESYTIITSNHWAWIAHESCFRRDGAQTTCNYNPDPEVHHPNGPRDSHVKSFETTLSINGTGSICPNTFSGETKHWARKFYFSVVWGAPKIKPASGGPYC